MAERLIVYPELKPVAVLHDTQCVLPDAKGVVESTLVSEAEVVIEGDMLLTS